MELILVAFRIKVRVQFDVFICSSRLDAKMVIVVVGNFPCMWEESDRLGEACSWCSHFHKVCTYVSCTDFVFVLEYRG